jgi:dihydroxyacetone kinase-like predicted kinase
VVGGDGLYKVHVHTNDPPAVVAAGRQTGRPEMERVVDLEAEVAELCLSGQARAMRVGERQGSALVAVAEGDGMAKLLGSLGAVVVREEPGEATATKQRLAEAIEAAPAESAVVVMRLSDGEIAADAEDAASRSPREVRVVVARSAPQALSAAAAFNPVSSADHNASAMAAAVDAVSVAALIRSRGEASVGDVAAGDWLGVVDGQVKMAGSGADEVAAALLGDLRQAGHEMLTILVGADGSEADAERMAQTLVERLDGIQVEVHRGDQSECPYLFGLE